MPQKLWIDTTLPGLNEIIDACRRGPMVGNSHKKKWQEVIGLFIRQAKLKPVKQARFEFIWVEKDQRRDKDNIAAGGRKYILDSLVQSRILKNDGWNCVVTWSDHFYTTENRFRPKSGVMVIMYDASENLQEMLRKIQENEIKNNSA